MSAAKEQTSFLNSLSSEPAIFFYAFAVLWYNGILPNLVQQKVCSPEFPPPVEFACNDTKLLAEATDIVTTRVTLRDALPAMILLFSGCWRDATSLNKPIMYFAIISEIIGISIEIFAYLNWTISPWAAVFADGIINGLGGGSKLFYIGATCAITDNTGTEDRTTRLTLISAMIMFGCCLASVTSGYGLKYMGYTWFLILAIIFQIVSLLLVMILVKDKKRRKGKADILKMFKQLKITALKRRPNNIIIWLMVFSSCSLTVVAIAEGNVTLYYLEKGFGFTIEEAGVYSSYRQMIGAVGTILVPPILSKLLGWKDSIIGIVSCAVTIVMYITMVIAKTKLELIIFALFDFMRTLLFSLPKSVISKCVDENEIGVFVSFCIIGECILPIGIFYLYDYIYTATSTTLPGAFFLASAVIAAVSLIFYSITACIYTPLNVNDEEVKKISSDLEKCEKESQLQEKP
ncbi:lysosomal proton-coupled steroid conjugate and bile acid symporter SLC46A3 [Halyomorpha halys]|uniref:lysosomal proton-coupled steroid conjugate and bile acid symporter SLC46A3 n=1 Tax=Halyomorpha halys TaxID=286706 RepID=UPI0006D4F20A|nr:uncharacterized protein LOC106691872 [Halyomorpha halys]